MKTAFKKKLLSLTWDDMREWSDSRSVERGRDYVSRVEDPVEFSDGSIVAEVHGSDDYFTRIRLDEAGELEAECTCPVGYRCKHCVALALVCAKKLKAEKRIEKADMLDRHWKRALQELDYADEDDLYDDDFDFEDDDFEIDDFNEDEEDIHAVNEPNKDIRVPRDFQKLSKEELRSIVSEICDKVPEARQYLEHRQQVKAASAKDLERLARGAIRNATSGWYDYWEAKKGRCELPDYSLVKEYFTLLEKAGEWASLKELAGELKRKATNQQEQSRDEGEISSQVSECMDIAMHAVMCGEMDAIDKIKWAQELTSNDDYGIMSDMDVDYMSCLKADPEEWSRVADYLLGKDKKCQVAGEVPYRGCIGGIVIALERADRVDEVVALLKEEPALANYQMELVELHLRLGHRDDAIAVCRQFLASGYANQIEQHKFLEKLKLLASEDGDLKTVAVCDLAFFIAYPRIESFDALRDSCSKIKCWKSVRDYALDYLEHGTPPPVRKNWPLPPLPIPLSEPESNDTPFPHCDVLCNLAIHENKTDDVLKWYMKMRDRHSRNGFYGEPSNWKIADAIAKKYPDEAIAIWRREVSGNLDRANQSCYQTICRALSKMRPVMKQMGKLSEWTKIVSDIQAEYKRRPSFMKMLRDVVAERGGQIYEWGGN